MFTKDCSIKSKNKKKLYIFSIFSSEMVNYHRKCTKRPHCNSNFMNKIGGRSNTAHPPTT